MSEATMNDLPSPLLTKILQFVMSPENSHVDLKPFLEVSEKWKFIIGNYIEVNVNNGRQDGFSSRDLGRFRISKLELDEATDHNDLSGLKHPKALKVLSVYGLTSIENYNRLARLSSNLRELTIGWSNMEYVGRVDSWIHYPQLHRLTLGFMLDDDERAGRRVENLYGLIQLLKTFKLPKLTAACINAKCHEAKENLLLDSILTFLTKHQKGLKRLVMSLSWVKEMEVGGGDWLEIPDFNQRIDGLSELQLDLFSLPILNYRDSENVTRLVEKIQNQQISTRAWFDFRSNYATFYPNFIQANTRTLTHVIFSLWIFEVFDCGVFEECRSLELILMSAKPKKPEHFETPNFRNVPAQSELINIQKLPKSIRDITLENIFLETKDTALFTRTEFPELESLDLQKIGEKETLGLTMEVFCRIVGEGINVVVRQGFNQRSLKENLSCGNGSDCFMTLGLLGDEDSPGLPYLIVYRTPDGLVCISKMARPYIFSSTSERTYMEWNLEVLNT